MLYNLTFVYKRITAKYSWLYIIVSSDSVVHNNPVTSIFIRTPGAGHCLHFLLLMLLCSRWDTTTRTPQLYVYNVNQSDFDKKFINQQNDRNIIRYIAISAKCIFFTSFEPIRRACNFISVLTHGVQLCLKNQIMRKAKSRCGWKLC